MSNRIKKLLEDRGVKPSVFAREIGVPQTTISSIVLGKTEFDKIRIGTFCKIAHGLGMTADELWGDEAPRLTADEQALLTYYRGCDERGRHTYISRGKVPERRVC